jgi:hypothetical protein
MVPPPGRRTWKVRCTSTQSAASLSQPPPGRIGLMGDFWVAIWLLLAPGANQTPKVCQTLDVLSLGQGATIESQVSWFKLAV